MSLSADTSQRCPHCAALVRPGTPWCTLCFADLRPASCRAAPSEAAVPSSGQLGSNGLDPLTAPLALLDAATPEALSVAAAPSIEHADDVATAPSWPCHRCGAHVPFDDGICSSCGALFLDGVAQQDPVLRRIGPVSTQAKVAIMVGGSLGLVVLFLGLMYLFGVLF